MEKAEKNGFGLPDDEIKKLIERDRKGREKALRNRVFYKLLVKRAKEAGLAPTDEEVTAEIAKMKK